MKYYRFRFGGEIAFRTNSPPEQITLDLIKKLLADRDRLYSQADATIDTTGKPVRESFSELRKALTERK